MKFMFAGTDNNAQNGEFYKNRVSIQGCGNVTPASLYSLLLNTAIDEIVLLGRGNRELLHQIRLLCDQFPPNGKVAVRLGTYKDLQDTRILVVAQGIEPLANESARQRAERGSRCIRRLMGRVKARGFHGIVLMTTVPVDLMTQVAQQALDCPPGRVIGIGSTLARPRSADARERRDLPVAVWCSARFVDHQQMDACKPECPYFEEQMSRHHQELPERRGREVNEAATCVMRTCEAILRDEKAVFPVSALATGQYGISSVYMHLPCVIGRDGTEKIVELPASDEVRRQMLDSARYLGDLAFGLQNRAKRSPHYRRVGKLAMRTFENVVPARSER
jgi:L-lactate dehydrogenase